MRSHLYRNRIVDVRGMWPKLLVPESPGSLAKRGFLSQSDHLLQVVEAIGT